MQRAYINLLLYKLHSVIANTVLLRAIRNAAYKASLPAGFSSHRARVMKPPGQDTATRHAVLAGGAMPPVCASRPCSAPAILHAAFQ